MSAQSLTAARQWSDEDLAKYTFLKEAGEFIQASNVSLSDLVNPDFSNIVNRAKERITESLKAGIVSDQSKKLTFIEIISFPISLALVAATGSETLSEVHAKSEAFRVATFLKHETSDEIIQSIFDQFLQVKIVALRDKEFGPFVMSVPDYLKLASTSKNPKMKLINRIVQGGTVRVNVTDLSFFIREKIRAQILENFKKTKLVKIPLGLIPLIDDLKSKAPAPKTVSFETLTKEEVDFPPCIRKVVDLLERNQDIPHYSRILLVTYFLKIGKSIDELKARFGTSPDFQKSQVDYIAGIKGSKVRYSVPACETLKRNSFCFMDAGCRDLRSPLGYCAKVREGKMQHE